MKTTEGEFRFLCFYKLSFPLEKKNEIDSNYFWYINCINLTQKKGLLFVSDSLTRFLLGLRLKGNNFFIPALFSSGKTQ